MTEHLLLLTGRLAERALNRVMAAAVLPELRYTIHNVGVSVASLMTTDIIERRLPDARGATRVIVPGLCAGDLDALARHFGVPVDRGPVDLKDLPAFLGGASRVPDLSRYETQIFAEMVDAPQRSIEDIVARAQQSRRDGADVIDLGCLPGQDFPHLEEAIAALHEAGFVVSVDSIQPQELLRAGRAGADYLLSLRESTLHIADECASVPILIPEHAGDLASLERAMAALAARGRRFIADSILDPIHFGFTAAVGRYATLRERHPEIEIMMGTGNVTELTEADTTGINAVLMGVISELRIQHLLTTEVSPHARSVVRELDCARRVLFAAREDASLPKGYSPALTALHERKPYSYSADEIADFAADVRDPNYRVQVTAAGIHVYNRDGLVTGVDPFDLFPQLREIEHDAAHAFYMGVELARAQIAWQLGKRYVQDEELAWGAAVPASVAAPGTAERAHALKPEKSTLRARRAHRGKK